MHVCLLSCGKQCIVVRQQAVTPLTWPALIRASVRSIAVVVEKAAKAARAASKAKVAAKVTAKVAATVLQLPRPHRRRRLLMLGCV